MEINEILNRGTVDFIVKEELEKKLKSGKKLRVKFGIDPTGSDLHIGHAVPLKKLKQFQDRGDQIILLIGDYTAKIGDPTGKSETRVMLSDEQIKKNMEHYIEQASRIINIDNIEIRYNSEWFGKMTMADIIELTSHKTINQILQREDFKNRIEKQWDVSLTECLYPLMQGYDSVMLESDIEIGGTDQLFNMLVGRDLQKKMECKTIQNVLTVPILEGLDGVEKMSKTYNNYIGITEEAKEIYGKTMSISDDMIFKYFELTTDVSMGEIEKMQKSIKNGENPKNIKMKLAKELVTFYYSEQEANEAEKEFNNIFKNKGVPQDIDIIELDQNQINVIDLIMKVNFASSTSEARRFIKGGAVKVDDKKIETIDAEIDVSSETILQVGKRKFIKIIAK